MKIQPPQPTSGTRISIGPPIIGKAHTRVQKPGTYAPANPFAARPQRTTRSAHIEPRDAAGMAHARDFNPANPRPSKAHQSSCANKTTAGQNELRKSNGWHTSVDATRPDRRVRTMQNRRSARVGGSSSLLIC